MILKCEVPFSKSCPKKNISDHLKKKTSLCLMTNELQEQLNKMKCIQNALLDFLDYDDNAEESYAQFISLLESYQILDDRKTFSILLNLLSQISIDHHRTNNLFNKIEKIISFINNLYFLYIQCNYTGR